MKTKMALKFAKAEAKKLGFSIRKMSGGDYRVNRTGGPEAVRLFPMLNANKYRKWA